MGVCRPTEGLLPVHFYEKRGRASENLYLRFCVWLFGIFGQFVAFGISVWTGTSSGDFEL